MNILHVITSLDPKLGGPQIVVTQLAAAQARLGEQVAIVAYHDGDRRPQIEQALKGIHGLEKVTQHWLDPPSGLERLRARGVRSRLDSTIRRYDVVHVHGVWDPILLAAAAVARQRGVPYVVTPHGMLDPWCLQQRRFKKWLAMKIAYGRMLNHATFLHALNDDEAKLVRPLNLQSPAIVVPNGVNMDEVEPLPPLGQFRQRNPQLDSRPFFLFLGRIHYKKGLDLLADAYAMAVQRNLPADLVVAGPDDGALPDFQQRIANWQLNNRVHVVGPIYGPQKFEALRDATAFVLPSRQEGFSMAITEALAARVPVIITENCHFPQVAQVNAGLVIQLDIVELADAMLTLIADPAAQKRMGDAGHQLVESHFTWTKIAKRLIIAYQRPPAAKVHLRTL